MEVACLGWGSLIWKPDTLPLATQWFQGGPSLPVEFARVSDGAELATVMCANAPPCPVLWAVLQTQSLDEACQALRRREQIAENRQDGIGVFIRSTSAVGVLAEWAMAPQLDAVIRTALPPRFNDVEGRVPSVDDAVAYLADLRGEALHHARDYVEKVPVRIDTPYRREIIGRLGWSS